MTGVHGAQLYDPDSGTWTATGKMTPPLLWHTATLLADGEVLAVGGDPRRPSQLERPRVLGAAVRPGHRNMDGRRRLARLVPGRRGRPHCDAAARWQGARSGLNRERRQSQVRGGDLRPGTDTWTAGGAGTGHGSAYLSAVALSDDTVLLIPIGASYSSQVTEPSAEPPVRAPEGTTRAPGPGPPRGPCSSRTTTGRSRCCLMAGSSWQVGSTVQRSSRISVLQG